MMYRDPILYALFLLSLALSGGAWASAPDAPTMARIAVASNFVDTLRLLIEDYRELRNDQIQLSAGSTGKLYAQIRQGAPFDLFLAADQARPALLHNEGLAELPKTYAVGSLVLWRPAAASSLPHEQVAKPSTLTQALLSAEHIATANPDLAPYGRAAHEVMQRLNLLADAQSRLVTGENVGQCFALIATGNAEVGFISLAQAKRTNQTQPLFRARVGERPPTQTIIKRGIHHPELAAAYFLIPGNLHEPIAQDMVLLRRGVKNEAAKRFINYLLTPRAQQIIAQQGYGLAQKRLADP